jgi:hypothetical protein
MIHRRRFLLGGYFIVLAALVTTGCGDVTYLPGTGGSGGATASSTTAGAGGTGGTGGGGGSGGTGAGSSSTLATFGGPEIDVGTTVAIDSERRIVIGGTFQADVDFGGGPLSTST